MSLHFLVTKGETELIRQALTSKPDLNTWNEGGFTPLLLAIQGRHPEIVRMLLDAGADVHKEENGERLAGEGRLTPLGSACLMGESELVELLLARGARVNDARPDVRIRPPLASCVMLPPTKAVPLCKLLLPAGADPNAFLNVGTTILDYALRFNSKKVIDLLRKAGAKTRDELAAANAASVPEYQNLRDAVWYGDLPSVQRLIAAGADVNAKDPNGATPLRQAAIQGHEAVFNALLEAGADIQAAGELNWSLLTYAAYGGNVGIVRRLLADGMPVDGVDAPVGQLLRPGRTRSAKPKEHPDWHTPLMAACDQGKLDAVKALLEAGADPLAKYGHMTALKWAKMGRHKEIVALLEGPGAASFDRDPSKQAVRGFAEAAGEPGVRRVIELLTELTEREPKAWSRRKGVFVVHIGNSSWIRIAARYGIAAPEKEKTQARLDAIRELSDRLHDEILELGCTLLNNEDQRFLLYPTTDLYAPLIACGTNGINAGHDTEAVVTWLRGMAAKNPFRLTGCSFDWVAGRFLGELVDVEKLAADMLEFCSEGMGHDREATVAEDAEELKKTKRFHFWWD